jgi:hypothetical protein
MICAALTALALVALPDGSARYRFEIGREPVGAAELSLRCAGEVCTFRWEARLRLPQESGAGLSIRSVELEVGPDGRARPGSVRHFRDGERWELPAPAGRVPASLAEVVLLAPGRLPRCVDVFDEESGAPGEACASAAGQVVRIELFGTREEVRRGRQGFPREVVVAEQGARYVRDAAARPPPRERAPVLYGARVPGPRDPASADSFCDTPRDARSAVVIPAGLPPPAGKGESCRDRAASWVATATRAGFEARTAVGVAWDGRDFMWHAWAEVRTEGGWLPVDPSFGQLPADGPRFTVARYAELDRAARVEAGRRVLACWGRAGVSAR